MEPDSGSRFVQPGATVRYLQQEPDFAGFKTTLAYVEAGLGPGDDTYQARYLLEQLGLTLAEGKQLLTQLQQHVVAHQASVFVTTRSYGTVCGTPLWRKEQTPRV